MVPEWKIYERKIKNVHKYRVQGYFPGYLKIDPKSPTFELNTTKYGLFTTII